MTQILANPVDLTDQQFRTISGLVKCLCGINLHEGKRALVRARLAKRLRVLGLRDFGQYIDRVLQDTDGGETLTMLDAISTNLTYFFREPAHFEILAKNVVPAVRARGGSRRKIRIWSAGCSSGEEPYSIAVTLRQAMPDVALWDVGILATDLSAPMLRSAMRGVYGPSRLRDVPPEVLAEHFTPAGAKYGPGQYRVKDAVRRMVHFARLNLMEPWPMSGPFDAIFCRNVMIYFDKATQQRLVERFCRHLVPGGLLMIGHSESLTGVRHGLRYVRPSVYQNP